jgi:DNA end-binding protein Ku
MAKSKRKTRRTSTRRASWRGQLTFGLVSFQVEAFNALDRDQSDIHFHQIHAECHRRIHYQRVCPVHGVVPNDEIISGYEYKKDKYVEVTPEELDELRTESDRALKIDAFVTPETVDPLYFDGRMYYLVPAGTAAREPFAVVVEAMEREKRYGVGQLVMSGKDQIALVRPFEGLLHMAMLNYEAEIRSPSKVANVSGKPTGITRQVRLAQTLIEQWSDDKFDFSKYEDSHREMVEKLIEAKMRGKKITPPIEEEPGEVLRVCLESLKRRVFVGP